MTRKELAELIKEIERSEERLGVIQEDKKELINTISENPEYRYWFNTTKLSAVFYPDELMALYNHTENKLKEFLDVNKAVLDDILEKVVL